MRRLRRFSLLFVLLLAAAAVGVTTVNRSVLPVKGRAWIEKSASEALGRPVSVGRMQIHWWHGFVLEKVSIADTTAFGVEPILEVDQISGGILFLPILKNREFVIPTLRLVRPRLRLLQNTDGLWNIQTLQAQPARPAAPARFRLLILHLLLTEGRIEIASEKTKSPLSLHLQNIGMDARLALPAKVEGSVSLEVQAAPPMPISLEGTFDVPQRRFQVRGQAQGMLPAVLSYLPEDLQTRVGSLEGSASVDLEASGTPGGPTDVHLWLETEGLHWKKTLEADGDLRARFDGKIPAGPVQNIWRHFHGSITLDRIGLRPVPYVEEIREMSGEIQVDSEGFRTERLTATVAPGIPVELSGSIANDAEQTVGLRLSSPFRLEQPPALLDPMRNFLKNAKLAGQAQVELLAIGKLRPEPSLQPTATITLDGCSAEFPKGCPWADGQAVLRWQPDLLTLSPLRARFLDRPLEMEGTLVNFAQPEIDARLRWGDLSAETQMDVTREKIRIGNLNGHYGPAAFRILGEIARPEPVANLFAESSFRLEQIEPLSPEPLAWISRNEISGECSARLLVQGDLSRPRALTAELKISSPELVVRKIPLELFSAEIAQEDGVTAIRSAQATVAGGVVQVSGSVRRNKAKSPWEGRASIDGLDLAQLGKILQWKNQTLSGQLQTEWTGTGEAAAPASVAGDGTIRVAGAQILEFPLLGRFADLVGAPALRAIAFREAEGVFRLGDGKIQTENLQLTSPQAAITIAGWGGFLQGTDSPIDWKFIPTFAPELIPEETRSKIGKAIAKGASYFMGEIRVTGTWKDPKRKLVSKPVTQILNEQLFNIQDILKDLF